MPESSATVAEADFIPNVIAEAQQFLVQLVSDADAADEFASRCQLEMGKRNRSVDTGRKRRVERCDLLFTVS